jgi:hypothetical protein
MAATAKKRRAAKQEAKQTISVNEGRERSAVALTAH